MITATPLIDHPGLEAIGIWDPTEALAVRRTRLRPRVRIGEIGALTIVALVAYILVAYWVRYDLHFWINDALNRTDDAIYVSVGRDPHLAAIGFYWPPLAQIIQVPLVPLLKIWNQTIMAGPISSAVCMALTIPVLARIGRRLHVGRTTTFLICLAFAINPVVIYYAAIGMSEACSLLFGAITMLGFLTWIETDSTLDLLVFTFGLSGAVMTRLEEPFVALVLAVVASFKLSDLRRSAWNTTLIGLPPMAFFGFWLLVQWIIEKDPLFFHKQNGGTPPKAGTAFWLPKNVEHPSVAVTWAGHWVVILGPILVLPAVLLLVPSMRAKARGSIGILAAMSVFAIIQIDQVIKGTGFGNPRYFVSTTMYAAVAALWIAARHRPAEVRRQDPTGTATLKAGGAALWNGGLVVLLLVGGVLGSRALTNGLTTHVEAECGFFEYGPAKILPILGGSQTGTARCLRPANGLAAWQAADTWLDHRVTSHDRILTDNSVNYAAELFTPKTQLFVVRNDTDWQKIVANPVDVTYILTQSTSAHGLPDDGDQGAALIALDPAGWKLSAAFRGADAVHAGTYVEIWHFVPPTRGATPPGTESNIA